MANSDPARHRRTTLGDVTDLDAAELAAVVRELAPLVRQRAAAVAGQLGQQAAGEEAQELLRQRR